jgi:two-component system, LytTR family, sensor kinase
MANGTMPFEGDTALKANIRNGFFGIIIGLLISIFSSIVQGSIIPVRNILLNILFSFFISLSITNSVVIYECFLRPAKYSLWKFFTIYYICNINRYDHRNRNIISYSFPDL